MTFAFLSVLLHGEVGNLGEIGYADEILFFFIAAVLLTLVGMSWFFVQGEEE